MLDLDDTEDPKLLKKIETGDGEISPWEKVCKDVKHRLLLLLEVRPSIEYLTKVTRVNPDKCFSRYGSIKLSQLGFAPGEDRQPKREGQRKIVEIAVEHSQHDDDMDELADMMDELADNDELAPISLERSKSQRIGLKPSLGKKP